MMTVKNLELFFLNYNERVKKVRFEIAGIITEKGEDNHVKLQKGSITKPSQDLIYSALVSLSAPLAASYAQVKYDLEDLDRVSWAGTAHEIREIVSNLLRLKAPDSDIVEQPWYKQETNTSGPTQKQRVKFILQKQSAGSKQREVAELVTLMEELIGNLVRATYSRASDAAHRMKGKTEAIRLFKYLEAFAHDLLDLQ